MFYFIFLFPLKTPQAYNTALFFPFCESLMTNKTRTLVVYA